MRCAFEVHFSVRCAVRGLLFEVYFLRSIFSAILLRRLCIFYIDTVRAFPLITVLFFGQLLIPLFLPMEIEINRVSRAIIAFSLFTSAYIAEDIRGGLQSIPHTQREAAEVLGFNKWEILQAILLRSLYASSFHLNCTACFWMPLLESSFLHKTLSVLFGQESDHGIPAFAKAQEQ